MVVSMDCGRLPLNNRKRSNYSIKQGHILIFLNGGHYNQQVEGEDVR